MALVVQILFHIRSPHVRRFSSKLLLFIRMNQSHALVHRDYPRTSYVEATGRERNCGRSAMCRITDQRGENKTVDGEQMDRN
jgi:hypothetical protein